MKQLFISYTSYNHWANKQLTSAIDMLTEEFCHTEIVGSFPSLYDTIRHLWHAEFLWWQRVNGITPTALPTLASESTLDLMNALLDQGKEWEIWAENLTDEQLLESITYTNMKGETFTSSLWQILQHIFNHASYHRGQVVMILRQLGVFSIPNTDYIAYCRSK